jgi:hypothetical protein
MTNRFVYAQYITMTYHKAIATAADETVSQPSPVEIQQEEDTKQWQPPHTVTCLQITKKLSLSYPVVGGKQVRVRATIQQSNKQVSSVT